MRSSAFIDRPVLPKAQSDVLLSCSRAFLLLRGCVPFCIGRFVSQFPTLRAHADCAEHRLQCSVPWTVLAAALPSFAVGVRRGRLAAGRAPLFWFCGGSLAGYSILQSSERLSDYFRPLLGTRTAEQCYDARPNVTVTTLEPLRASDYEIQRRVPEAERHRERKVFWTAMIGGPEPAI